MTTRLGAGRARLRTYSASSDSRSPAFTDQTEMYGRKEGRTIRFTAADPELREQVVCSAGCDAHAHAR